MIRWVRLHSPNAGGAWFGPDQETRSHRQQIRFHVLQQRFSLPRIRPGTDTIYIYLYFIKHKFRRICITFSNQNLRGKTHKLPVSRAETRMGGMQHGLWLQNEGGGGGGTKFYYVHPHLRLWKLRLGWNHLPRSGREAGLSTCNLDPYLKSWS